MSDLSDRSVCERYLNVLAAAARGLGEVHGKLAMAAGATAPDPLPTL